MEHRAASLWDFFNLPDDRGTMLGLSRACICIRVSRGSEVQSCNSGTGFFFEFNMGDQCVPCIVTNRHLVSGFSKLELYVHTFLAGDKMQCERIIEIENPDIIIYHPDPEIDLAIIGICGVAANLFACYQEIFAHTRFTEDMIDKCSELYAKTPKRALICGYPKQHDDYMNPLIYDGHIGTCTRKSIFASITSNIGNSGSPLCIFSGSNNIYTNPGDIKDIKLIGIVRGVFSRMNTIQFKDGQTAYPVAAAVNALCLMDFKPLIEFKGAKPDKRRQWYLA